MPTVHFLSTKLLKRRGLCIDWRINPAGKRLKSSKQSDTAQTIDTGSGRERTRKPLQDLEAYKEQNSHMTCEDKSPASFCTNIRQARKNLGQSGYMKLTEERISALDGIDFDWRGDLSKSSVGAKTDVRGSTQKDDHHKHGNEAMISLVISNDRAATHEMPCAGKTRDEIPFSIEAKPTSNMRLHLATTSPSVSSVALSDLGFNRRVESEQMEGLAMSLPSGLASSAAGPLSFQPGADASALFTKMELTEAPVAPLAGGIANDAIISHIGKPCEKSTVKDSGHRSGGSSQNSA